MLALVAGLGALYALVLAAAPVRDFFDLELLSAGQWFLALLSVAAGLVLAAVAWRIPFIQRLEAPDDADDRPAHRRTGTADPDRAPTHSPAPTTVEQHAEAWR